MEHREALTPAAALAAAELAAGLLSGDSRVRLVFLFGSSLESERAAVGDVDLAILCEPPLTLDQRLLLQADLVEATGAPIDLVSLNEAGVILAHEVADTGRCLFARNIDIDVEFVTRARSRYWDFKPYLEQQWKLLGERLAERRDGPSG